MSIKITENGTKNKSLKIICQNCKVKTNHQILTSIEIDGFEEKFDIDWSSIYQIIQCKGCDDLSFRIETEHSEMNPNEKPQEIVFPERSEEIISNKNFYRLPYNVDKLYQEVVGCYNNNILTLCGVGIRALVEAICLEKNIVDGEVEEKNSSGNIISTKRKNNLEGKINGLFENGILTKENAIILHDHRLLGNEAVHQMSTPNKETLKIAISIIESVLESIYEMPYKSMKLKQTKNKK
jgi:hypothetical protein